MFSLTDRADPPLGQVGKVLGDRWKALDEKARVPYEKKAQTDKKRYEDEKAKYNVSATPNLNTRLSVLSLTFHRLARLRKSLSKATTTMPLLWHDIHQMSCDLDIPLSPSRSPGLLWVSVTV